MIFSDFDFEHFMDSMLANVPENIDKREGDIIWDALAPVALELTKVFIQIDWFLKNTLGDTAEREWLIRRAEERGLTPYEATYSTVKGEFNTKIEISSRFKINDLIFIVLEELETQDGYFYYSMQCETAGEEGNIYTGDLIPINYIDNLKHAKIVTVLYPGENEEDTEDFRKRYYDSINNKSFGGNIADYTEKVESAPGVSRCKIYPIWNGGGTVKVVFQDSEFMPPSEILVNEIQELLDPQGTQKGLGLAPIGHLVTVEGAKAVKIDVLANLVLEEGIVFENIKDEIKATLEEYFAELRGNWADSEYLIVRQAFVEAKIVQIKGVIDINNINLNSNPKNIILADDEVPVLGSVLNG